MRRCELIASLVAVMLCASSSGLAAAAAKEDKAKTAEGVVNINGATAAQLQLLPSIGPAKARRIIAYRQRRPFRATYQLTRVRGIGRRTYRRLRRYLVVEGPTTLRRRPK